MYNIYIYVCVDLIHGIETALLYIYMIYVFVYADMYAYVHICLCNISRMHGATQF